MFKNLINYIKNHYNKNKILNFRFAPEPSGYIHLGHIKSLYLNYFLSKKFKSNLILRFDDTNPKKSKIKYINNIIKDLNMLNINFFKITYTSNYFNILYKYAINLIKNNLAYIDFKYKKSKKYKKKIYNKYRNNNIEKNLYFFKKMKKGKYKKNECVLRAKINSKYNKNIFLQDPIMYRIIYHKHYKTKYNWCIYPTYDWSHGQCDLIEKISYSLCSQEFEHHKILYNWYINKIHKYYYYKNNNIILPKQFEYSRLNINYNLLSKRKINYLIKNKILKNWKDPRILTLKNLKKRGYNNKIIFNFIETIGYSKRPVNINFNLINNILKKKINNNYKIIMCVTKPIKIIIINNKNKYIKYNIYPFYKKKIKYIKIYLKNKIFISEKDFIFFKKKNIYKLSFNRYIRLKNLGIIKIIKILYNYKLKKIITIYCKLYNNFKKKIKSTIQWISNINKYKIKCFCINNKMFNIKNIEKISINKIKKYFNYKSLKIKYFYTNYNFNIKDNKIYQFLRIGYFFYNKNIFYKIFNFKKNIFYKK